MKSEFNATKWIQDLSGKYPKLKFSKAIGKSLFKGAYKQIERINASGIQGNPDLNIVLRSDDDVKWLEEFLKSDPYLFTNFLGCKVDDIFEIGLNRLTNLVKIIRLFDERPVIKASLWYNNNHIQVETFLFGEKSPINILAEKSLQKQSDSSIPFCRIYGLDVFTKDGMESDVRNILYSVLFDIEYSFNVCLEVAGISSPKNRRSNPESISPEKIPENIQLTYKAYIPELIEYLHIGDKVEYVPFKYLCAFHVIEYFMDKCANMVASKKLREIVLKPDFHQKTDDYVSLAINLLKQESDKNINDKAKINRVFREFIDRDEINAFLTAKGILPHFNKEVTLTCSKNLKLSAIDFSSDHNFYETMTKRIYAMRCSIVHSNPDFDEAKAIPFTPSETNLKILTIELILANEIARMIIAKTSR